MLELIQKIKTYTEAGIILEHMELLDILEANARALVDGEIIYDDDEKDYYDFK